MNPLYFNVKIEFNKNRVDEIIDYTINNDGKGYVCSVNSNNFVNAYKDQFHRNVVNKALVNICDGSVMALLLSIAHGKKLKPYVGADLFLEYIHKKKYQSFFLGSTDEILSGLKENLSKIDPNINKMASKSLPFLDLEDFDYHEIAEEINSVNPDIIWVSLGAPKQEKFMFNLLPFLKRGVMFGFGAILVFNSGVGKHKRAPIILRKMNLEWLYRIVKEPMRILPRFLPQIPVIIKLFLKDIFIKRET